MARVSHPNILTIFDFGVSSGVPYLVLEYVEEGDLRHLMRGGRLPASQVRSLMRGVNEAIAYLHQARIIHRDIKPENILMKAGKIPRVADFGLATFLGTSAADMPAGTPGYVSPEQRYGLPLDERTDQYALAALAYELLTGEPPVGSFPPPSRLAPDLPPAVDQVIMKALKDSPIARYARVDDFAEAFDKALLEETSTTSALPSPAPAPPPALFRVPGSLRLTLLTTALFASGLAATYYYTTRTDTRPVSETIGPPGTKTGPETVGPEPQDPRKEQQEEKETASDTGPELSEQSLINLWAYLLWLEQGRPKGVEGEKLRVPNRERASELVRQELESLSYAIWKSRGSLEFEDPEAQKAESDRNWKAAHEVLYSKLQETINGKSVFRPTAIARFGPCLDRSKDSLEKSHCHF